MAAHLFKSPLSSMCSAIADWQSYFLRLSSRPHYLPFLSSLSLSAAPPPSLFLLPQSGCVLISPLLFFLFCSLLVPFLPPMDPRPQVSARSTADDGRVRDEDPPPPISPDGVPDGPVVQAPSPEQQQQQHPPPAGLTPAEYASLRRLISSQHTYTVGAGQCSSLLSQRTSAPADLVWSYVRRFDRPQVYKHFIRSCVLKAESEVGNGSAPGAPATEPVLRVGCLRELRVISGLPASTSTDRLDVLDDVNRVTGYTIVGGEHRLRNYRSTTTVSEVGVSTVVLESYVVDIPEGNTQEDTRLFADTVVRLNLQKLAHIAEAAAAAAAAATARDGNSSNNHFYR